MLVRLSWHLPQKEIYFEVLKKMDWITVFLAVTVSNIINYLSIREILWSIVWLNRRGKLRKFLEYKKTVRQSETIASQISMRYLLQYVSKCKTDFVIWWKVKRVFVCVESMIGIIYVIIALYMNTGILLYYFSLFMLTQAILSFIILRFQLGIRGRLTRYDRMRLKR